MSSHPPMSAQSAVIIGAGPAGLTAAYELVQKTAIRPIIYEQSDALGGLAQTINYKGNRIDIGGHRFFSKSDRVMKWWETILPIQGMPLDGGQAFQIQYQNQRTTVTSNLDGPDPEKTDRVMLIRQRVSRIFFLRCFFDYPIALNMDTVRNLGIVRMARIAASYSRACLFQIRPEKSLEDFFINRFGSELYHTFFKDYTEKVWGVPCDKIRPEWGAQRIKGLSVTKAVFHALKSLRKKDRSVSQKQTETSLIEKFLYPKFGPGQMWEEVARIVRENGSEIHHRHKITKIRWKDRQILEVVACDELTGQLITKKGDFFFSTMPVRELIQCLEPEAPKDVRDVAEGLVYRDFITVGVLLKKLKIKNKATGVTDPGIVPDNWIYIQENDVKLGRLQIFNNWSPYLIKDPNTVWLGLEYFCNEGDELWRKPDPEFAAFAIEELARIDMIQQQDVLDSVVIRMPKTYPAYFGSYDRFDTIKLFLNQFENLFLIGRNGMHRYNNQDHSMLTAMTAVENIINGVKSKDNIWAVNTEMDYHEEKGSGVRDQGSGTKSGTSF